ncbi:MAG: glutamine--tRNA ligase/YqeY domain fusion protein [Spirochaetes bacterium]|nr:glutamine--tRNA ligase/YqeY domain fusion protein [Spirochaetota bacterium]MBN2770343.1 glutamine--tRNA ligase/YqeY domain fusion protein [Spirochaetota bacterium]
MLKGDYMETGTSNFIEEIINDDLKSGKNSNVVTRFPPEPNGYLHIGHAKSICLNFGLAKKYNGRCHLRFDDTNPSKEEDEYINSIQEDVRWLGFDWGDHLHFASDYFDKLYDFAILLIKEGKAYVCDLSADETREYRGTLKEAGKESPYRNRSVEENLELFSNMKAGKYKEGEKVLRAKIDMKSGNICMRDPIIYRIQYSHHHRTGDKWCIYPMYDFTHCLSDAIEGVTHSVCTLEFKNNRDLYDWVLQAVNFEHRPRQIEFARLNLNYTVMSKRLLLQLVRENHVSGWDDPRMPTISGLRRRGFTPESVRDFTSRIGVAKADNIVDIALLEHCLREDLNKKANRAIAVLNPLKLIIENFPENEELMLEAKNNPEDESAGSRMLPFTKELFIERDDFKTEAPKKYFRLAPGMEVRLKFAFYVTCTGFSTDDKGNITEVRATYDPDTKGGWSQDGRKVKGTIHWLSAKHAKNAEVRIYDRLFQTANPYDAPEGKTFLDNLNPESLTTLKNVKIEESLANAEPGYICQFERTGYFCSDIKDHTHERPVYNRAVPLRDSWAKIDN